MLTIGMNLKNRSCVTLDDAIFACLSCSNNIALLCRHDGIYVDNGIMSLLSLSSKKYVLSFGNTNLGSNKSKRLYRLYLYGILWGKLTVKVYALPDGLEYEYALESDSQFDINNRVVRKYSVPCNHDIVGNYYRFDIEIDGVLRRFEKLEVAYLDVV